MENIQEKFFSKNNIIGLNNKLLENLNATSANNNDKIFITNTLIKHMQSIWKTIDIAKINTTNFNSVFNQFNTLSMKNSLNELNEMINKKATKDPATLKFERDFNSNPNSGVNYLERSQTILSGANGSNSFNKSGSNYIIKPHENNFDSSLDTLFRPLINENELDTNVKFNNYQTKKDSSEDFNERLKEIQQSRNVEVPMQITKNNNNLPDFLKSKPTNVRVDNNKNEDKEDNNIKFLDAVNHDDNLFSLDNIDKPLILAEIEEDNTPFSERLKKLQNERDNISLPQQQAVDFKGDKFKDTFDQLKNLQPTVINQQLIDEEKMKERKQQKYEQHEIELIKQKQYEQQQMELIRQQQYEKQQMELLRQQQYQKQQNELLRQQQPKQVKQSEILKKKSPQNGKKISEHREIFDQLKNLNKNLLNQVTVLKQELETTKHKLVEITNNQEETRKFNDNKFNELNIREFELQKKENEYIILYNKYLNLIKPINYQIEISPDDSISNYRFNLSNIINTTAIKLLNYSIPTKKFNIEENINNMFKYKKDDVIKVLMIDYGFYSIEELLDALNNNSDNITFELNKLTQKVKIISEEEIYIINTPLLYDNLGFRDFDTNEKEFIADIIWNLKIDNKVYLYIKNLNDAPFAILNPNNTINDSEIKFENEIPIEYLDIVFKDSRGNEINFYKINHYLNLQITGNIN